MIKLSMASIAVGYSRRYCSYYESMAHGVTSCGFILHLPLLSVVIQEAARLTN